MLESVKDNPIKQDVRCTELSNKPPQNRAVVN